MTPYKTTLAAASLAAALLAAPAQAGDFSLAGDLQFHNQVLQFDFSLAQPGVDEKIWTDAWSSGLNFDPTAALWVAEGSDFSLLAEVDDDDTVAPGQGFYDTGFVLPTLAAGAYRLTLGAAVNAARGTWLSQGFLYDDETAIALADWNQPSFDPNANDQKGTRWQLHFSGVDRVSAVPEPASALLLSLGGLALLAAARRRGA